MTLQGFFHCPAFWALVTGSTLATTLVAQTYQTAPLPAGAYPPPPAGTVALPPAAGGYPALNTQPRPAPGALPPSAYPAAGQEYSGASQRYNAPQGSNAPTGVTAAGGFFDPRAAGQANPIPATVGPNVPGQYRQVQNQQPLEAAAQPPAESSGLPQQAVLVAQPGEHPLAPAIRWARQGMAIIEKVQDYSCTLVKRERIDGTLSEHDYMFVKVRQQPLSVYMYFLAPAKVKGQEVLYVAGQNDGNMLAHPNGLRHKLIGTLKLKPDSMLAMSGNRYPITELGIRRLLQRLIEVGDHDMKFGDCEVKMIPGAKVSGRDCTCIQVVHTVNRKEFIFNMARIFVDNQLNLPIRYEAYEWPKEPGGPPLLAEEYTYLNLKLNNGFTNQDFDPRNPNYQFQ